MKFMRDHDYHFVGTIWVNIWVSVCFKIFNAKLLLQDNSSAVLCSELKLFVRVRSNCNVKRGKIQYPDIPNTKQSLLLKCLELKDTPV